MGGHQLEYWETTSGRLHDTPLPVAQDLCKESTLAKRKVKREREGNWQEGEGEGNWQEGEGNWKEGEGNWQEGEGNWQEGEGNWQEGQGYWEEGEEEEE